MIPKWFRAAAAILLLVTISSVLYVIHTNRMKNDNLVAEEIISPEEVLPGSNKAILSLADGNNH
jgi:hypothetical protein